MYIGFITVLMRSRLIQHGGLTTCATMKYLGDKDYPSRNPPTLGGQLRGMVIKSSTFKLRMYDLFLIDVQTNCGFSKGNGDGSQRNYNFIWLESVFALRSI